MVDNLNRQVGELRIRLNDKEEQKSVEQCDEKPSSSSCVERKMSGASTTSSQRQAASLLDELRTTPSHQLLVSTNGSSSSCSKELDAFKRLKQIIEDHSRETEELRAKQAKLTVTNEELQARVAGLEQSQQPVDPKTVMLVKKLREEFAQVRMSGTVTPGSPTDAKEEVKYIDRGNVDADRQQTHVQTERSQEEVKQLQGWQPAESSQDATLQQTGAIGSEAKAKPPIQPPMFKQKSSIRSFSKDPVDQCLQEYLNSRPDFAIQIEKVKPGWYVFGEPISKKLYLKVSGDHVVCRVGGGHKELFKFLDDYRHTWQERVMMEERIAQQASKMPSGRRPVHVPGVNRMRSN
jgi:hypothetical protein